MQFACSVPFDGFRRGSKLSNAKLTTALPVFTAALDNLEIKTSPTRLEKKTIHSIRRTLAMIREAMTQDSLETKAWKNVFLTYEAGAGRASLESRVSRAQQLGLVDKTMRLRTEDEIDQTHRWLQKLHDGYECHKKYLWSHDTIPIESSASLASTKQRVDSTSIPYMDFNDEIQPVRSWMQKQTRK